MAEITKAVKYLESEAKNLRTWAAAKSAAPIGQRRQHRALAESIETALSELTRLQEEVEGLRGDKARLDYLDEANAKLNARFGTTYGWKLIMTHNVNRLMIGSFGGNHVDLHDSEGGNAKLASCRAAIDERMRETLAARAALATLQGQQS